MRRFILISAILILLIVIARLSVFTVGPKEYVYLTDIFGNYQTFDGSKIETDAGLHFCYPWPIQTVRRLDRRLQYFDLPKTEVPTRDVGRLVVPGQEQESGLDKMLIVEAFACWRIADQETVDSKSVSSFDPVDRFIRRVGTLQRAEDILGQRINSQVGAFIGQISVDDLVNTQGDRVERKMKELREQIKTRLEPELLEEYGVVLVDVQLRRFNHSPQVQQSIFSRIQSERNRKAEEDRSEGLLRAKEIESKAEEEARNLLAEARKQAEILKGEADTKAALIRNQAHSQDPGFYVFLKKLENMQSILGDNKTVLLLSSHRAIFDMLFQPPQPGNLVSQPGQEVSVPNKGNGNGISKTPEKK